MHEGTPYGHLKVNSKVIDGFTLSKIVGVNEGECIEMLKELETAGVVRRTPEGVLYSKRMVDDERIRQARSNGGKLGGNPDLGVHYNNPGFVYLMTKKSGDFKIGISVSPEKRAYKLRVSCADDSIKVERKKWVQNMGEAESIYHEKFSRFRIGSSEWFAVPDEHKPEIYAAFELDYHLKVNSKVNSKVSPTPSSSSSSSSSSSNKVSAKAVSPEHQPFIDGWCQNYKAQFGIDYKVDGGRDGKAVKELLSMGILRIDLLEISKKAWKLDSFECKKAQTIHGFRENFNQIHVQVKNGNTRNTPNKPNPRNFGVVIGPTNYATGRPRLQVKLEAEREAARMAQQVASNGNQPPPSPVSP